MNISTKSKAFPLAKFRSIPFSKRPSCVVCGTKSKEPLIRLPKFPLTEIYVEERVKEKLGFVDQLFYFCERCGHGQLAHVIDPAFVYAQM